MTPRRGPAWCATTPPSSERAMRAWLPERQVYGPERAGERDIDGLNRVFAEAFTDRYRRDGLVGVRVPQLNPDVWRYALLDAGEGAMLWRDEAGQVAAMVLGHSAPLAEGRPMDEVRILKLAARDERAFDAAIVAVEAAAARAGIRRVGVRCQTRYTGAFRRLIARGYRVRWTDLRMTQDGYPEQPPAQGVLFSNWEI